MTEPSAPPLSLVAAGLRDPDNPAFSFDTPEWNESISFDDTVPSSRTEVRRYHLTQFKSITNPTAWNRYLHLGLYAYDDGLEFDCIWDDPDTEWDKRHKIVWYNYMYHLQHNLEVPIKLKAWATIKSQPFLQKKVPEFMEVDTRKKSWRDLYYADDTDDMEVESESPEDWTEIGGKQKSSKMHHQYNPRPVDQPSPRIHPPIPQSKVFGSAGIKLTTLSTRQKSSRQDSTTTILGRMASKSTASIRSAWAKSQGGLKTDRDSAPLNRTNYPTISTEETNGPTNHPMTEDDFSTSKESIEHQHNQPMGNQCGEDKQTQEDSTMAGDSAMKQSAFQENLNVPINDGTQRITIRWSPGERLHQLQRPQEWTSAAMKVLKELFAGNVGVAYRWESRDLATWRSIDDMEDSELREYLSPQITYLASTGMYIFGLRFGFPNSNPVEWQSSEQTKDVMRRHKVWATVSNSSCHGGKLVYAGYLLMKAPNSTHKIRYLQSLRNQLPTSTPYFDIVLLKKTPLEQHIHHLAVQCGENHVAPLTKSLSMLLKGPGGAVFLPRLVLGSLHSNQIRQYFETHDNYLKSLRSITLSPMVTNLDTSRKEFFPNGDTIERSTREWATQLQLPSGALARCDIVNGGKDRITRLLVPRHLYSEVMDEVSKYKLRLNPLERREARFRDSIPGLPEIIQIDTSVKQSLEYLDKMTLEEIWKQPASPDLESIPPGRQATNPTMGTVNAWHRHGREGSSIASNLSNPSGTTEQFPRLPGKRTTVPDHKQKAPASEEATGSTHSAMTPSIASLNIQRYNTLEAQIRKQQDALDQGLRQSEVRLTKMEKQLEQLRRLDELEAKMITSMEYHVDTNTTLGLLTRQMDTLMTMMTLSTQVTQDDVLLKQARASLPSDSVRKSKFNQMDRRQDILAIPESTNPSIQLAQTSPRGESINQHEKSPQKKKQKPGQDDTNSMIAVLRDDGDEKEIDDGNEKEADVGDEDVIDAMNCDSQLSTDIFPTTQDHTTSIPNTSSQPTEDNSLQTSIDVPSRVRRHLEFSAEQQRSGVYPIFHPREAPTDLDDQYNSQLDPDGGEPD
ncbi:hypothetical protein MHU86_19945 [Fragilaria crotonensis]|nr:hypothetical protein MHU86_19945 [Fragilaria crotonensis]